MLKKLLYRLLFLFVVLSVSPVCDMNVYAAPAQMTKAEKAKLQREKAKQKRQKEQARKREQRQKEQARAAAKKDKEAARKKEQTAKKEDRNAAANYREEVERVRKYNAQANAYNKRDIHHSLGVWGYMGYSALFQNMSDNDFVSKTVGGFGGGVGLGYQLQYKHFLFNAGLEYEHYNSLSRFSGANNQDFSQTFKMLPYETMEYTYHFSEFVDRSAAGYLQLPLLFGGEWGRYYFLAGPKLGLNVLGTSATSSYLTTDIVDRELIAPLSEMLTHSLVTNEFYQGQPTKLQYGFDLSLAAEFGIYLDEWIHTKPKKGQKAEVKTFWDRFRYRIGVFADYGVLSIQQKSNIVPGRNLPVLFNDATQPLDLSMVPMLTTERTQNLRVNPFLVGVKLAIFYELPRKQKKMLPIPPEPLPNLAARVVNAETGSGISGAMLSMYHVERDRVTSKTTGKNGMVVVKQRRGAYQLWAQRSGFMPSDTVMYNHESDLKDTVLLMLTPVPRPVEPTLAGYVRDGITHAALEANVTVLSMDGKELYLGQAADDGLFVTDLKAGQYITKLTAAGYMPQEDTVTFVKDTIYLSMQHIVEGKKVVMRNMFFATNKTKILPQSEPELEALASFLNENPSVKIRIIGHTDAVGSDEANQILSEGRANAVRDDLITRGIDGERIEAEGRGETEHVADNDTEEGRQKNRRVEFEITDTGGKDIKQIKEEE